MSTSVPQNSKPGSGETRSSHAMFEAPLDNWLNGYHKIQPVEPKPSDTELHLQSMLLRTPNEPLLINGQPYDISVDKDELTNRVNEARSLASSPGHYDPRALYIELSSDTLPESLATRKTQKDIFDYRDGSFYLEAPKIVGSPDHSNEELVNRVEHMLNRDLEQGFDQHRGIKERITLRKLYTRLGAVALAGTGEGVAIVTSDGNALELIGRGSLGAVAGASIVGIIALFKAEVQKRYYGSTAFPLASRAYKHSEKNRRENEAESEERIISLIPVQG